jgi:large subunit ribosomal protein L18
MGSIHIKRKRKVRMRVKLSLYPRLVVTISNRSFYTQIIDQNGMVLAAALARPKKGETGKAADELGDTIAKAALAKKISRVVFDRGARAYHGTIQKICDGARRAGLTI